MSNVHVNVHARENGINVEVNETEVSHWLCLRSGGSSVTFFVKDLWDLVSLADQIVMQVEDQMHMQIWPRAISADGEVVKVDS